MDIGLNENFDIELDQRNDLPLVEGRDAFEQRLAMQLTAGFDKHVGSTNRDNLLSILRLEAERVVDNTEEITEAIQINIGYSDTEPNTVEVEAFYQTDGSFSTTISE